MALISRRNLFTVRIKSGGRERRTNCSQEERNPAKGVNRQKPELTIRCTLFTAARIGAARRWNETAKRNRSLMLLRAHTKYTLIQMHTSVLHFQFSWFFDFAVAIVFVLLLLVAAVCDVFAVFVCVCVCDAAIFSRFSDTKSNYFELLCATLYAHS